jgi:hypothetical protein
MWKGPGRHHRKGDNLMSVSAMVKTFLIDFSFSNQDEQKTDKATDKSAQKIKLYRLVMLECILILLYIRISTQINNTSNL